MSTPERDLIVGGQAVIEGVMMRTPNAYAIAVRKADGSIVNTAAPLPKWSDKYPILKLPILRGGAVLVQSMGLGIKALNYSANEAFVEIEDAKTENVKVALSPAVIEGEGDFAGLTGAMPGLFPVPTQKRSTRSRTAPTTRSHCRSGSTRSLIAACVSGRIGMVRFSSAFSSSVCTRIWLSPDVVTIGDSAASMPVAATAHMPFLFWDGRKDSLWAQALGPLESPVEHGGSRTQYAHLIDQAYRAEYEALFAALYRELRGLARRELARSGPGASLGVTSLLLVGHLGVDRVELDPPDGHRHPRPVPDG